MLYVPVASVWSLPFFICDFKDKNYITHNPQVLQHLWLVELAVKIMAVPTDHSRHDFSVTTLCCHTIHMKCYIQDRNFNTSQPYLNNKVKVKKSFVLKSLERDHLQWFTGCVWFLHSSNNYEQSCTFIFLCFPIIYFGLNPICCG